MLRVLVVSPIDTKAMEDLASFATVTYEPYPSPDRMESLAKNAEVIVLRSGITLTSKILQNAPNLRIIARAGVGVDNIDLAAAIRQGVTVFNVPHVSPVSVAELTLGLMIALSRKITYANATVKQGIWKKHELTGGCIKGKTVGIIGLGRIGREVASLCKGMGMNITATLRKNQDGLASFSDGLGIKLTDLETLLHEADFVTLHVPLTEETKGMISAKQIASMKASSFIINTSRAGIVDECALSEALKEKKLAGAALDTFDRENIHLFGYDNVILTPHIGATTHEAQEEIGQELVKVLKAAIAGGSVENSVI